MALHFSFIYGNSKPSLIKTTTLMDQTLHPHLYDSDTNTKAFLLVLLYSFYRSGECRSERERALILSSKKSGYISERSHFVPEFCGPFHSHACVPSCFSHVRLFVTLWTIVCQAPLSMEFSRQEYWSGLPCPPPGDLPGPGTEPMSLTSPALAMGSLPGKPLFTLS